MSYVDPHSDDAESLPHFTLGTHSETRKAVEHDRYKADIQAEKRIFLRL